MEKNSLATICFEQIHDKYYYGLFGNFKLVINTENGFFNATKLCSDGGKYLYNWLQLKQSKELIKYLCDKENTDDKIFQSIKGNRDEIYNTIISGTYLPKQLILSIASWISIEFYFKVSNIVEDYFIREFTEKYKNDAEQLRLKMAEIESEKAEIESENGRLQSKIAQVKLLNEHLEEEKRLLKTLISEFQNQSAIFREDVAPKTRREATLNTLVIVRKKAAEGCGGDTAVGGCGDDGGGGAAEGCGGDTVGGCAGDGSGGCGGDESSSSYPYYAVRCQRRTRARAMRNLRKRYPYFEVAHEVSYNPNAVNLYNRARERLRYAAFRANHLRVPDFQRFRQDLETLVPKLI